MQKEFLIAAADDGVQFIDSPELGFLKTLGETKTTRASNVEPANIVLRFAFHSLRKIFGEKGAVAHFTRNWSCWWRVNMTLSGGPVLQERFAKREDALAAEINWFERNRL